MERAEIVHVSEMGDHVALRVEVLDHTILVTSSATIHCDDGSLI